MWLCAVSCTVCACVCSPDMLEHSGFSHERSWLGSSCPCTDSLPVERQEIIIFCLKQSKAAWAHRALPNSTKNVWAELVLLLTPQKGTIPSCTHPECAWPGIPGQSVGLRWRRVSLPACRPSPGSRHGQYLSGVCGQGKQKWRYPRFQRPLNWRYSQAS